MSLRAVLAGHGATFLTVIGMLLVPAAGAAEGYRQHAGHQHGVASLNLVISGSEAMMEFDSPAANLLGFEHRPVDETERAAADAALASLGDPAALFVFPAAAGCRPQETRVEADWLEASHTGDEHEHEHEHEHQDTTHDKGDHPAQGGHRDLHASYLFVCDGPADQGSIEVRLMEAFPGTERIVVQYVIGDRQGAAVLTPAAPVLRW
jgi:hypothetical protein